jgi:hypothetical protein
LDRFQHSWVLNSGGAQFEVTILAESRFLTAKSHLRVFVNAQEVFRTVVLGGRSNARIPLTIAGAPLELRMILRWNGMPASALLTDGHVVLASCGHISDTDAMMSPTNIKVVRSGLSPAFGCVLILLLFVITAILIMGVF